MRNVNELIGVIEGIQFDEVINAKEIQRLQMWVDKNRNLAYDEKQADLIRLVDSVLEDNVISAEEKAILLEKAQLFLENKNNISVLYELNGIIDGIICDDEVNELELEQLKTWMEIHGEDIKSNKISDRLLEVLNDVLEDGIITEIEQADLMEILSSRISNIQFETKLDYLCEQVRNRNYIGTDLIEVLDNESDMQEIHHKAENELIKALASYSGFTPKPELIVVSLVLIAMLEYDGSYYDSVRNVYTRAYGMYSEQKVEGQIRTILGKYKKQGKSGSRSRIINVALENAIVPQKYLTAFFEFIFDIYKLNFEYDIPDDPYEDFEFVYEGLRSTMLSEGDNISINVTQKTYKLIVTTKHLITESEGLDSLIKFSIIILKLIDKRFWEKEIKIYNPYLKVGYEGWEKQIQGRTKSIFPHKKSSTELRSRWEPKYVMYDEQICLLTPIHRVKAQYDYKKIAVVVTNDGKEIYRNNNCDIREIIGGYQINTEKIILDRPLGKVNYKLIAGDETIYDSRDKLHRRFIVFDEDGQEIQNNTEFEGAAYFCYREGEAQLTTIYKKTYYSIGYKLVRKGDVIEISHDVFNFSAMTRPGVFGTTHTNCRIESIEGKTICPVFKEANVVVFEADNASHKFEIVVNGKSNKLADMVYESMTREALTKYVVELGIELPGIYRVEVNQFVAGKKNRILKEIFAYDPKLTYEVERKNNSLYEFYVSSAILGKEMRSEIEIDNFVPELIGFEYDGEQYNYYIPFDFGFYKILDNKWNLATEDLWIEDVEFNTVLTIYDSMCDGAILYNEDNVLVEENITVRDKGFMKEIPIGFLNSYVTGNRYTRLVILSQGKEKYTIFCYNKCVLEPDMTEFVFWDNPKHVEITPVFHGKNKVFFEVFDALDRKVYKSKMLSSGQTDSVTEFNSFEEYRIEFHENTKILQLRKNTLLYSINRTFYAKCDFVGRSFKIAEIYYDQFSKGKFVERVYHFNKVYVRFMDIINPDEKLFEGEVYVKTIRGEWVLDKINPVEIEMCSDVVDDTMDVYITNQGDGLLFDMEKKGIMNDMEHPTSPDIFLYTIKTKEEN